ncbi:hypothetical protein CPB86DRAFT_781696 [Serendipita vermifera]|nr:hypothetical protein CPB86DRAFT_781696 [Serendipita vermifera]
MSTQPYSERNPVPTIQKYEEDKQKQEEDLDNEIKQESPDSHEVEEEEEDKNLTQGQKEKKEMMEKMNANKQKPIEQVKKRRGQRVVDDPVTGEKVIIKDAEFKDFPSQQQLDPKSGVPGPALTGIGGAAKKLFHQSRTAPNPAYPSNISLQPFPPSTPPSLDTIMSYLYYLEYGIIGAGFLLWFFLAFGHGFWVFVMRSIFISSLAFAGSTVASLAQRKLEREVERVRYDMHRQRGEKFAPPTPESVEWLNAFTKVIWGLINPDMFVPIADSIEDVMQQSLPKFVEAIRISDIGQGTNPFRIISMRALPDQPGEKEYPREEWIDQGTNELMEASQKNKNQDMDQAGDYVNYEVAFAYQALPGQGDKLRAKNIHLLLEFFLGFADWVHIPIPIWVQVDGVAGTVRLRIQFIPEPPFVRNLTFTLMGVPAVDVSVTPLIKRLPNLLDLPLISKFVKMAIAAGTASLVAPKSMTLNIQELMSGAAIGDTRSLGVFIIRIQYAEDLSAQDRNGKSDPYIVLAYAKFGKPLYSTRIILGDLNPVFEETAFLLVTQEEVKADENLSAMLWDSDKHTADDLIGRVEIPVKELMAKPNKMFDRVDKLVGFENATAMSGTLHWSIGYFDKVPLNRALERPPENPVPAKKPAAAMEMRPGDKGPRPAATDPPPPAPDVQRTPPDPKYPSGILSVVIHQINNLERQNLKGASGDDREGQAGQDTDEPGEQGSNLPSGYCEIIVNDDMVYKTRVKQYTSMPFFEAGTEVFIRNWQETVVRVVVRDSRLREKDPILGIVNLPLAEILKGGSEVTSLFSIQEGVGFGRANISVLFKAVDAKLPPHMLGWDTGTVEILKPIEVSIEPEHQNSFSLSKQSLVVSTTDSTEKIGSPVGDPDNARITWNVDTVRLPVYNRYSSSLTFEIGSKGSIGSVKGKPGALAIIWLQDYLDDEEVDIKIPVLVSKDLKTLRQNYINEHTAKGHEYKIVGWLTTRIRIDKGLDPDHEKYARSQARRHTYEAYDHIEGQALIAERNAHAYDDGVVDKKEKKALEAAHKKQLQNRHRGIAQFRPYRTAIWMKEGIKRRVIPKKSNGKREPTVKSEA